MRNELLIMIKHIFNWKRRIFSLASALIMACIFALGTATGVAIASNDKNEGVLVDKYTFDNVGTYSNFHKYVVKHKFLVNKNKSTITAFNT